MYYARAVYSVIVLLLSILSLSVQHDQQCFKLNDGQCVPVIALGTSLGHLPDGTRILSTENEVSTAVYEALSTGYRHVDTASLYRTEVDVGIGVQNAINDGIVTREQVYITTKLWIDSHEREQVIPALKNSLKRLNMSYVDLYLIHFPFAYKKDGSISLTDYTETWQGLEGAKQANLTKSIGVSNFNITQLKRLIDTARVPPAVLQIEVNPTIVQHELVDFCQANGIQIMAYSPFGGIFGRKSDAPPPRYDDVTLLQLRDKYNKTSAQIVLRYLLDRNIIPIPRSVNQQRIRENFDIFDFKLTDAEIKLLNAFDRNYRLRTHAKWYQHPHFPFERKNLTQEQIQHIIENSKED